MGQLQHVSVSEIRADQVLAGGEGRRRHNARGHKILLSLIMDIEFEIQFLLRILDQGVTRTTAVQLLQTHALRVIVIKGRIHQEVEARRDIPVLLSIEVDDVGLCRLGCRAG